MKTLTLISTFAVLATVACSSGFYPTEPEESPYADLAYTPSVSKCGGFGSTESPTVSQDSIPSPTYYCDAERLHWTYDATKKTLTITDARVMLNCCGEHSMTASKFNGMLLVTEVDAPVDVGSIKDRCACMCVFDYSVSIAYVDPGIVKVQLDRNITDSPKGVKTAWTGTIDLSASSGDIVIDESSTYGICGMK